MNNVEYLILSSRVDYSTDLICIELKKRNKNYLRLNRDAFAEYDITYSVYENRITIKINGNLYNIDQSNLKSIFFRAPVFYRCTGKRYSVDEQLKRSQWSAFIRNLVVFDKALWINHPVATYRAKNKMLQLRTAVECGFDIPETYVCNCLPQTINSQDRYIVKSLDTALFYDDTNEMFTYSTVVEGKELLEAEIKSAPVILQNYLFGKTDIRVTVVNDRIFPVTITSQGHEIFGDWRKQNKDNLTYTPIKLPSEIEKSIMLLMKKLNLSFGGIDLALVEKKYYFIEINPTGEWGWLVSNSCPIDKTIVDYMQERNNEKNIQNYTYVFNKGF